MHQTVPDGEATVAQQTKADDYTAMLRNTGSLQEAGAVIAEALRIKLCKILGLEAEGKTVDDRVDTFGLDSLIALGVRDWLAKEMRADLAVYEILGDVKLADIGLMAATKSELLQAHKESSRA
ncbi:hypothetical protein F4804DRAFT_280537 [Jackrogersella minutella]|nr:hypothetical protein F4804DRAFT_280537 [Jackrogersella minutella]